MFHKPYPTAGRLLAIPLAATLLLGCKVSFRSNLGTTTPDGTSDPAGATSDPASGSSTAGASDPGTSDPGAAPKTLHDVWLIDNVQGLKASELDRADDVIALMNRLSPSLLVRVARPESAISYCFHTFFGESRCARFDAKDDGARDPGRLDMPSHGIRLTWRSELRRTNLSSSVTPGTLKPLTANTPGFILWGVEGTSNHGANERVIFMALDGGVYVVEIGGLEMGAGDPSAWPADVQHSGFHLPVVTDGYTTPPPHDVPDALVKAVRVKEAELLACSTASWGPAEAEFQANDVANITEITRRNRERDIEQRYMAKGTKQCRPKLEAMPKVFAPVLDHRLKARKRVYEAAKKKFGGG